MIRPLGSIFFLLAAALALLFGFEGWGIIEAGWRHLQYVHMCWFRRIVGLKRRTEETWPRETEGTRDS